MKILLAGMSSGVDWSQPLSYKMSKEGLNHDAITDFKGAVVRKQEGVPKTTGHRIPWGAV